MAFRPAALASVAALALAARGAPASPSPQDGATAPISEVASADPAPLAAESDLRGRRARAILRRGAVVEGVLPGGIAWERRAEDGSGFEPAKPDDPAAGLRFFFVMGMDGEIFLSRSEVKEIVDIGSLSDAQAEEMKAGIIEERRAAIDKRRRDLEAREAQLQRELERLLGPGRQDPAPAAPPADSVFGEAPAPTPAPESEPEDRPEGPTSETPAPGVAAAPAAVPAAPAPGDHETPTERRRRGDALLERFPPPAWSVERFDTIDTRTRLAKIPPDEEEAAFLAGFEVWREAFDRRAAAEAARKAGTTASDAGGN